MPFFTALTAGFALFQILRGKNIFTAYPGLRGELPRFGLCCNVAPFCEDPLSFGGGQEFDERPGGEGIGGK